jgi:hypothetical protein
MRIDISICPTQLEFPCGDRYDEEKLLAAICEYVEANYPDRHPIYYSCLQVGHRQGDAWATVDGDPEEGRELLERFFAARGADEELFAETA